MEASKECHHRPEIKALSPRTLLSPGAIQAYMLTRFVSYGAACSAIRQWLMVEGCVQMFEMEMEDFDRRNGSLGTLDSKPQAPNRNIILSSTLKSRLDITLKRSDKYNGLSGESRISPTLAGKESRRVSRRWSLQLHHI